MGDRERYSDEGGAFRDALNQIVKEVPELGGLPAFRSGDWLVALIRRSLKNYTQNANVDFVRKKYETDDKDLMAAKLTRAAAGNAAILGAIGGATVASDELSAFVSSGGGVPANIAGAFTSMAVETILLLRIQLQLVANLAALYDRPLSAEDPEDVLTIFAYSLGITAGGIGKKAAVEQMRIVGKKTEAKLFDRIQVKHLMPLAAIGIGGGWNYLATLAVGRAAKAHFTRRNRSANGRGAVPANNYPPSPS